MLEQAASLTRSGDAERANHAVHLTAASPGRWKARENRLTTFATDRAFPAAVAGAWALANKDPQQAFTRFVQRCLSSEKARMLQFSGLTAPRSSRPKASAIVTEGNALGIGPINIPSP